MLRVLLLLVQMILSEPATSISVDLPSQLHLGRPSPQAPLSLTVAAPRYLDYLLCNFFELI